MPAVVTSPVPSPDPFATLLQALSWAVSNGLTVVAGGDHGIICDSHHATERWKRNPCAAGITVIGAAVLRRQPPVSNLEHATMFAIESPWIFVEGVADGCARSPQDSRLISGVGQAFYLDGFEVGTRLRSCGRNVLHTVCAAHSTVYPISEPCPCCEEDELARADDEVTVVDERTE